MLFYQVDIILIQNDIKLYQLDRNLYQGDRKMKIANDLGYGYLKITLDGERVKFPSVVAYMRQEDILDPIEFSSKKEENAYMNDLLNHIQVSITSPAIKNTGRIEVGNAAIADQLNLTHFDVFDYSGKSESDLSLIITLSTIAAKAVKDAYNNGEEVFGETLKVETPMVTALPISEGKRDNAKDRYKQRYLKGTHTVTFTAFANPITVNIKFKKIGVAYEGETAQLSIRNADDKLKNAIWKDFQENYPELATKVTIDELISYPNVLGIDIGAGTTDLVVILNGRGVPTISDSINMGFNNVLAKAVRELKHKRLNYSSPTELQEFLSKGQYSFFEEEKHATVLETIKEELIPFQNNLISGISMVMQDAGSEIGLVFVYGGGSITLKEISSFRAELSEKLKSYNQGKELPIIWIDPEFAPYLNRNGLEEVAEAFG